MAVAICAFVMFGCSSAQVVPSVTAPQQGTPTGSDSVTNATPSILEPSVSPPVATVVAPALGAFLGGSFARLPSDQRQQLDRRLGAAVGDRLNGLADVDKTTRLKALIQAGYARLDDKVLI